MTKLFTADWCVNCQPIKQLIKTKGYPVDVVNVDEQPELVRASGVRSIPSLVLGDGSVVVGTEVIKNKIEELYGPAANTN